MEKLVVDKDFWLGRKVFLTGHTGFKGSWLAIWLDSLGALVTGYSLESPTTPAMFNVAGVDGAIYKSVLGDICDSENLTKIMQDAEPEVVIHMAAQSLVRDSYVDPVGTYKTNIMGTINVFEAARKTPSVKAILNVTTDKCYENKEWEWGYRENEPMGGHDPYSNSKACSELITNSYRASFFKAADISIATGRAGNVIGGGDWAKDRIVPDAIRAFMGNKPLVVRNPLATRPWQHVLEPLSGYLILCQQLILHPNDFDQGWNFGPGDADTQPVSHLVDIVAKQWGQDVYWELDKDAHPLEARDLKLDCSKARTLLKWCPVWNIDGALYQTVSWYKAWLNNEDMLHYSRSQIAAYQGDSLSI